MRFYIITITLLVSAYLSMAQNDMVIPAPEIIVVDKKVEQRESSVYIPISISQDELTNLIHAATPERYPSKTSEHTKKVSINVKINDKQTIYTGNTITHKVRLEDGEGWLKTRGHSQGGGLFAYHIDTPWLTVDCNGIRGNGEVALSVGLNSSYEIKASARLSIDLDNANCSGFNATGIIKAAGKHHIRENVSDAFNNQLRAVPLKAMATDYWNKFQDPQKIDDGVYLHLNPSSIYYKDFKFEGGKLMTGIGITAKPVINSDSVRTEPLKPITPLLKISDRAPELNINIPIDVSYEGLQSIVSANVVGTKIKAGKKKKKYAKVLSTSISGDPDENFDIVIGMELKFLRTIFKNDTATMFLKCNLDYNKETKTISITDYELDAKTKNALVGSVLDVLANKVLYGFIKKSLSFPMEKEIDKVVKLGNAQLEESIPLGENLLIEGLIEEVTLDHFQAQNDHLVALILTKAKLKATVKELSLN